MLKLTFIDVGQMPWLSAQVMGQEGESLHSRMKTPGLKVMKGDSTTNYAFPTQAITFASKITPRDIARVPQD